MCMVSAVFDYGNKIPDWQWTQPAIYDFRKAVDTAEQFDISAGEADCVDPEKAKLLEKLDLIEQRLKLLEEIDKDNQDVSVVDSYEPESLTFKWTASFHGEENVCFGEREAIRNEDQAYDHALTLARESLRNVYPGELDLDITGYF